MELIFSTGNQHKLKEAQEILGEGFKLVTPQMLGVNEEIEETGTTLSANAILKADYLWKRFQQTCFADDTGLEVDSLGGRPGVYSARYAGEENNPSKNMSKLLKELEGIENRSARFKTVIALILDGSPILFEGCVEGEILKEPIGEKGFGYDPIFKPQGFNISMAQLSSQEKNSISHRGKAIRQLSQYLHNLRSK